MSCSVDLRKRNSDSRFTISIFKANATSDSFTWNHPYTSPFNLNYIHSTKCIRIIENWYLNAVWMVKNQENSSTFEGIELGYEYII